MLSKIASVPWIREKIFAAFVFLRDFVINR